MTLRQTPFAAPCSEPGCRHWVTSRLPRNRLAMVTLSLSVLLAVLAPSRGFAQAASLEEVFAPNISGASEVEFSYSPPGARSLAMGGAFVGRADDATAAYANPAGLVQLRRSEVSIELRSWTYPASVGSPRLQPNGGVVPAAEIDQETRGPMFLSYVYPRDRWTLAVYRYTQADFDTSNGPDEYTRADLVAHGLAGSWRFDNGLSVGAVLLDYKGSLDTLSPCRSLAGPCSGAVSNQANGHDVSANLGALWRLGDRWSLGAVYRRGPRFAARTTRLTESFGSDLGVATVDNYQFRVPDTAGLGVGFHPTSRMVINFDLIRVSHSQILTAAADRPVAFPSGELLGHFRLEDADEIHIGIEQSFWNVTGSPAFRFGGWWEPAHELHFRAEQGLATTPGLGGSPSPAAAAALLAERWGGGKARLHWSAGFGLVFGRRLQMDAAADFARSTRTVSLSTLVRF